MRSTHLPTKDFMDYSQLNYSYIGGAPGSDAWLTIQDLTKLAWVAGVDIHDEAIKAAFLAEMVQVDDRSPSYHDDFQSVCHKYFTTQMEANIALMTSIV
jgi:hypothetical protein